MRVFAAGACSWPCRHSQLDVAVGQNPRRLLQPARISQHLEPYDFVVLHFPLSRTARPVGPVIRRKKGHDIGLTETGRSTLRTNSLRFPRASISGYKAICISGITAVA